MGSHFMNDDLAHHTAVLGSLAHPTKQDPYRYQHGFGNHHLTEAFPGALPRQGTNLPQKHPYGLYAEHLNGTSFISSRESASNVWMYRVRPSVAHRPLRPCKTSSEIESCFLPLNPNVDFTPRTHTWGPFRAPHEEQPEHSSPGRDANQPSPEHQHQHRTTTTTTTFVDGLRTLCGHGDPTLKAGLAVHLYAFDADMIREAYVNHDGELLLVPQRGTLDIQTELGYLRVAPGSIAVIPPGIRFAVAVALASSEPSSASGSTEAEVHSSAGSDASGYVLEIFGAHFRLPELGPLGANGLAHPRDFQYPVASFDVDFDQPAPPACSPAAAHADDADADVSLCSSTTSTTSSTSATSTSSSPRDWRIITKLSGRTYTYTQPHTPFDVVAWHGRYAPYRYDLARFGHLTANADQLDPTAYCVLTAPSPSSSSSPCSSSSSSSSSLVDFCLFGEKYAVARDTLRIPYHHRTVAAELVGVVRGRYGGSARRLEAGGLSFEQAYMPHGETYECWRRESERVLEPGVVGKDFLGFMFHVSAHVGLTKWATERHPDIRLEDPHLWDNLRAPFIDKLNEVRIELERTRRENEMAIQAELTALAFEIMVNRRRLSVTDDEDDGLEVANRTRV